MKTKLAAFLCLISTLAFGQNLTSLFDYAVANGTTNGASVAVSGVHTPVFTTYIQTGAITNAPLYQTNVVSGVTNIVNTRTNIARFDYQMSLDSTNWLTFDTAYPTATNASIRTFVPSNNIPLYIRIRVSTSNGVPAAVFYQ